MSTWQQHLIIAPVILPLATGALLVLLDERRHTLKAMISVISALVLLATAFILQQHIDGVPAQVYALGNWPAPFGIVLVADRLSAVMVLLASVLALAALLFSLARWHRTGPRFHALVQFLLMGLNGAFLTGDLFNLFVFFELLLAASYALALHGSGAVRVKASLHYITINVTASLLFLIGASLIYAVTGTLNMADLAVRIPAVAEGDRVLLESGASILGVAFLIKAGMWPLCFWLPSTYAASSAPAAALFAILSKVGVYAILRLWLLFFGTGSGASAGFGEQWLVLGGMMTLVFGMIGVLASQELPRLVGFSLLVSSGTLLAAVGVGQAAVTAAALYYLIVSTLGVSAFYLLIELIERGREPGADVLAVTAEEFGDMEDDDHVDRSDEIGFAIPATMAFLGLSFACCALLLAGLPPMPGFIGKFALLSAFLGVESMTVVAWVMLVLLTMSGLAAIIAMSRTGIRIFWASQRSSLPRVSVIEATPILLLLALCALLTFQAGPAMRYLTDTAASLHAPRVYVDQVLPLVPPGR
ncbi:MAG TPA: monovalent cation/H+ antiporter subunit D [Burkholderiaceae bacterium]|nr:monovalent cation/H+ antiporter subunit D [Burkholderiaceae bacterium]